MIKSLSPHYVNTSFLSPLTGATCTEYTLQLYAWSGAIGSVPASPAYESTIVNIVSSTDESSVNISRLINDFIEFTTNSDAITNNLDGNNQLWVQHNVIYNTSDVADDGVKQNITTDLVVSGYGYGLDGENPTSPADKMLIDGLDFNINKSGYFIVPILLDTSASGQTATAISYPNNEINKTFTLPNTSDSTKLVQYLWIGGSEVSQDTYIEVTYNGVTVTLYVTDECKYTPVDIAFQNKYGALQILTFFKQRKDSIAVTSEVFESDRGQPSTGAHQFVNYNVNSKSKFKVNSGFVDEELNETFKQLLLSERVWLYNGDFVPLNIAKKSIEYKTVRNDKLINYEIDFDYSFNDINTI